MQESLPFEVWSRCWWKQGPEGEESRVAAFLHASVARTWAEGWYGCGEQAHVEGKMSWKIVHAERR